MSPDDYITWAEFVTLFVRFLNYDVYLYLNNDMNYPDSYIQIAEKIGWEFKNEGYVTFEDTCRFIFDVIQTYRIAYLGNFSTPQNQPFGIVEELGLINNGKVYIKYICASSKEEEKKIKQFFSITNTVELVNKPALLFYRINNYNKNDTSDYTLDALIFVEPFKYKGYENGILSYMYSKGTIDRQT